MTKSSYHDKKFEDVALLTNTIKALSNAIDTMKALSNTIEAIIEATKTYIANLIFRDIRFLYRNELLYYIDDNDYERLYILKSMKIEIFN